MNNFGIFMESVGIIDGVTWYVHWNQLIERQRTGVWIGEARRFLSLKDSH